ncbi:MAG: HlyD family efflux transporter periplasmic adaptor subunit [Porticoccaceae bacterium]|nr:HlyD family efflux transporter periplasmic adaptor subunit [Porticoccaceae bacterium]
MKTGLKRIFSGTALLLIILAGILFWWQFQAPALPAGITAGNGRVEATEYDIATKRSARVAKVFVSEGDMVGSGQVLAQMDCADLQAQLREAEARLREAKEGKKYAEAIVEQRKSELAYAEAELNRSLKLVKKGHVSEERLDQHRMSKLSAEAALTAAQVLIGQSVAGIDAATARIERLNTDIADSTLKAPVGSRVLYRLAEPGEVLPAGGKVLTVLDLADVYMTIFLPTAEAGRVSIGADARITLDAISGLVIPAKISFVAARAQFTPREVETRTEREKLMFRIKVKIDPTILLAHIGKVKTGVPGMAYIKLDPQAEWPTFLEARVPTGNSTDDSIDNSTDDSVDSSMGREPAVKQQSQSAAPMATPPVSAAPALESKNSPPPL